MNEQEIKFTEKNLKNQKKLLEDMREQYQYAKDRLNLDKMNRAFTNQYIGYLNKIKGKAQAEELELLNDKITDTSFVIKSTEDQLKNQEVKNDKKSN